MLFVFIEKNYLTNINLITGLFHMRAVAGYPDCTHAASTVSVTT